MNEPKRYRRRPKVVRAIRFLGDENYLACAEFCPVLRWRYIIGREPKEKLYLVETPEGEVRITPGNWLAEGSKREFYPIQDDIFQETMDEYHDDDEEERHLMELHLAAKWLDLHVIKYPDGVLVVTLVVALREKGIRVSTEDVVFLLQSNPRWKIVGRKHVMDLWGFAGYV